MNPVHVKTFPPLARREFQGVRAFIRADLLALLAALLLLAGIFAPAWASGKGRSQAMIGLSNLRQMAGAISAYSADFRGYLPPNVDTGASVGDWAPGEAGNGGANEGDPAILQNKRNCVVAPYVGTNPAAWFCPASSRAGQVRQISGPAVGRLGNPARSYTMNGAAGTGLARGGTNSWGAPWLDGNHGYSAQNKTYYLYTTEASFLNPGPEKITLIVDENEASINDGSFGFSCSIRKWVDYPTLHHGNAGQFSFADGHAEVHRWRGLVNAGQGQQPISLPAGLSVDWAWIANRITARQDGTPIAP
jgi:prepilin-type processing-associated H-X9-DG protein